MTTNHYFIILNGAGLGGLLLKTKTKGSFKISIFSTAGIVCMVGYCKSEHYYKGENKCTRKKYFSKLVETGI